MDKKHGTYLSKEWNCIGRMACASLFSAGSGYGIGSGPHSAISTGAATRLFSISLTLMPLVWLILDMDVAGFSISLGCSVKLSCDFFTSDDKVDKSSLIASGPAAVSRSAPSRMLATCSSPIPESVWGTEVSSWISSPGVGVSFSFTVSGNVAGVSVMKKNWSIQKVSCAGKKLIKDPWVYLNMHSSYTSNAPVVFFSTY